MFPLGETLGTVGFPAVLQTQQFPSRGTASQRFARNDDNSKVLSVRDVP